MNFTGNLLSCPGVTGWKNIYGYIGEKVLQCLMPVDDLLGLCGAPAHKVNEIIGGVVDREALWKCRSGKGR